MQRYENYLESANIFATFFQGNSQFCLLDSFLNWHQSPIGQENEKYSKDFKAMSDFLFNFAAVFNFNGK